jgi:hypothetical protein
VLLSLVSAPVLGYDLVRHPQGNAIATVLLRALACGPDDLVAYAAAQDRTDQGKARDARAELRSADAAAAPSLVAGPAVRRGRASLADMVGELRQRMIVDIDAIDSLIHDDVLAWCGGADSATHTAVPEAVARAAGDAFTNAITALWARGPTPAGARRLLATPFLDASTTLHRTDPQVGPNGGEIRALLSQVRGMDDTDRARLRAATAVLRPSASTEWTDAMHEASWAAFTTGRIRAAAAAQLFAVRSYFDGGLDAHDGAEGLWNVISGCVQGSVVADVLPDQVAAALHRVWRTVFSVG